MSWHCSSIFVIWVLFVHAREKSWSTGFIISTMTIRTGFLTILAALLAGAPGVAQVLNNQSLNGKFFVRHVSLGTDGSSVTNLADSRSLMGTLTFDGSGGFTFVGQQVTGTGAPASASGKGSYTVDAGGFVTMDNPIRSEAKINARYSLEALLGSS